MRPIVVAIFFVLYMFVCRDAQSYDARSTCPVSASEEYFFPLGLFKSAWRDSDEFVRKWYSYHLRTMGEPSLSCGVNKDTEIYRFVWFRTFHRPIAIRVSHSKEGTHLVAVESTGAGGYVPGLVLGMPVKESEVPTRVQKVVSDSDWQALVVNLGKVDFWKIPTKEVSEQLGTDGAQWIIEGRRGNEYHIVDRWTPRSGFYRSAGFAFLKLSGLSVPDKDIY